MSRKHSTALGIGAAMSGAAIATFLSMGIAHATPDGTEDNPFINTDTGGFSELFGGTGTAQGPDDLAADVELLDQNSGDAASFSEQVATFETSSIDHPIVDIVHAIDPSAFEFQSSPGIDEPGFFSGDYLVPDSALGYLATDLDFFLLNPVGLSDLLGPIGEILLGGSFT
jgi:hypothetical protein